MSGVPRRVRALPPVTSGEAKRVAMAAALRRGRPDLMLRRPLVLSLVVLIPRAGMAGRRLAQARRTS
jgi:hypothetical protein